MPDQSTCAISREFRPAGIGLDLTDRRCKSLHTGACAQGRPIRRKSPRQPEILCPQQAGSAAVAAAPMADEGKTRQRCAAFVPRCPDPPSSSTSVGCRSNPKARFPEIYRAPPPPPSGTSYVPSRFSMLPLLLFSLPPFVIPSSAGQHDMPDQSTCAISREFRPAGIGLDLTDRRCKSLHTGACAQGRPIRRKSPRQPEILCPQQAGSAAVAAAPMTDEESDPPSSSTSVRQYPV